MPLPQRVAATPDFIPHDLRDAAPGHRYQLYLQHWQGQNGAAFAPYKKASAQGREDKAEHTKQSNAVLKDLCPLPASSIKVMVGIQARQQALILHYGPSGYRISTTSTAPFATGLGNEHPIENGFAFLTPYGLPYLAGSGVKGILRRAMQELRDTDAAIDALFGPEKIDKPEDARRGALDFWDVFPKPFGDKLVVEIMTPHFGGYYQGKSTPHDSGAPIPVSFLAVPAKSQFDFHVVCQPNRLPESLRDQWRVLLDRAFQHAFEWVGFGAKTSVGYGAMQPASELAPSSGSIRSSASSTSQGIASNITSAIETWPSARVKFNRTNGTLTAESNGAQAHAMSPKGETILNALPSAIQAKIRRNEFVKAKVLVDGNILIKLEP